MKMKKYVLSGFLLLPFLLAGLSACTKDKLPEPMAGAECEDVDATYSGAVKEIIDQTCAVTGCHVTGGGSPGNFSTYAGLQGFANDGPNGFRDRVINLRNDPNVGMPPDYATSSPINLTDEQLKIFRCWANAGFPEN